MAALPFARVSTRPLSKPAAHQPSIPPCALAATPTPSDAPRKCVSPTDAANVAQRPLDLELGFAAATPHVAASVFCLGFDLSRTPQPSHPRLQPRCAHRCASRSTMCRSRGSQISSDDGCPALAGNWTTPVLRCNARCMVISFALLKAFQHPTSNLSTNSRGARITPSAPSLPRTRPLLLRYVRAFVGPRRNINIPR